MIRFLPGLIIIQIAAGVLVMKGLNTPQADAWVLIAVPAGILTLVVASWFGSIADHLKKDALAQARENFVREREKLLVAAEADKRTLLEESHRQVVQETNRAHAKASFKLGAAFVGVIGAAAAMLYVQLVTVGILLLAGAGGALGGYLIRARQDRLAQRERLSRANLARLPEIGLIEADDSPAKEKRRPDPKRG